MSSWAAQKIQDVDLRGKYAVVAGGTQVRALMLLMERCSEAPSTHRIIFALTLPPLTGHWSWRRSQVRSGRRERDDRRTLS